MLNSTLLKSLCQISALVYKPNSFFVENFTKEKRPPDCECFDHIDKQPLFLETNIDCQCYVSTFNI